MKRFLSILILVCLAAPAAAENAKIADALRELFAQGDPTKAEAQQQAVLEAVGGDADKLIAALKADTAYAPAKPGLHAFKTTVDKDGRPEPITYYVFLPHGYTPEKSWPTVLAGHGQTGDGQWAVQNTRGLLGNQEAGKYVVVAPTLSDPHLPGQGKPRTYSARPYQEQTFLKALRLAGRAYNLDDNHVYVSGYSMGGHTAWHLPTVFPHLFAAAVPMAGVPHFEGFPYTTVSYMSNLQHVPLWSIWGELDRAGGPSVLGQPDFNRLAAERLKALKNEHFIGTELKGVAHGGCYPPPGEYPKFLAKYTRNPTPEKITHNFHLPHHARGYYLEATALSTKPPDFTKPPKIKVSRDPRGMSKIDRLKMFSKHFDRSLFRFQATLNRKTNTLTIKPFRIKTMRLYVTQGLFDPKRPAVIKYWRRVWRGTIPTSAACILKHYTTTRDAQALVLNEIDLTATRKPVFRFPGPESKPDATKRKKEKSNSKTH